MSSQDDINTRMGFMIIDMDSYINHKLDIYLIY